MFLLLHNKTRRKKAQQVRVKFIIISYLQFFNITKRKAGERKVSEESSATHSVAASTGRPRSLLSSSPSTLGVRIVNKSDFPASGALALEGNTTNGTRREESERNEGRKTLFFREAIKHHVYAIIQHLNYCFRYIERLKFLF
jgi:hypothetical protein